MSGYWFATMTSASFKPMSARFRTNNRTAYVNWMLEHKQAINSWYKNPAFVRDESIAVHAPSIREAITREFGSDALRVLRESQAWFRERVRLFLKEGGDPAF